MEAVNITPGPAGAVKDAGILYPLMLIAAAAVIVFSIAGIATMMGWMPSALTGTTDAARTQPATATQQAAPRPVETQAAPRERAATGQRGSRR